jgi:hypothetical protein
VRGDFFLNRAALELEINRGRDQVNSGMKGRTKTFSSTTSARNESDSFHCVVNGILILSSMLRFKKRAPYA